MTRTQRGPDGPSRTQGLADRDRDALDRVLAPGGIETVFQPLVDLRTGATIGFEALSRGRAHGAPVAPDRLFALARRAGSAVDLDWACRCQAFSAAVGRVGPEHRLFVNAEPAAFDRACPTDLLPAWLAGYRRLRVVVELTERDLLSDPAGLLRARATVAELGWELALDDVGANDATVALLPLLQPEVVKLDRTLLGPAPGPAQQEALRAVRAYARDTGARVVAEGIETAAGLARAREVGADWGQGYRLGRPGPLPVLPGPAASGPARAGTGLRGEGRTPGDPLRVLGAGSTGCGDDDAVQRRVAGVLRAAAGAGPAAVVLLCDGTDRIAQDLWPLLDRLADAASVVAVLGGRGGPELTGRARRCPLGRLDPVAGDCGALLLAPGRAMAFHARPDGSGGWDCTDSTDPRRVADAARALLSRVAPLPRSRTGAGAGATSGAPRPARRGDHPSRAGLVA